MPFTMCKISLENNGRAFIPFMAIIKYRFMPIKFHSNGHETKYKLALMALILEVVVMTMNS